MPKQVSDKAYERAAYDEALGELQALVQGASDIEELIDQAQDGGDIDVNSNELDWPQTIEAAEDYITEMPPSDGDKLIAKMQRGLRSLLDEWANGAIDMAARSQLSQFASDIEDIIGDCELLDKYDRRGTKVSIRNPLGHLTHVREEDVGKHDATIFVYHVEGGVARYLWFKEYDFWMLIPEQEED